MTKRAFGELELAILQIFKQHERLTVRDVLDILKGEDKYTTIMTVMNRMVEKKLLMRQRCGQQYEYWENTNTTAEPPSFLDKLKQKIFGGKSASMISYLLESGKDITKEELEEMEKRIHELRKSKK